MGLLRLFWQLLHQWQVAKPLIRPCLIQMTTSDNILSVCIKHLAGQHNQKRHGWRYSGYATARNILRRTENRGEREEYRKRAFGKPATQIEKISKPAKKYSVGGDTYTQPAKISSPAKRMMEKLNIIRHGMSALESDRNYYNNPKGKNKKATLEQHNKTAADVAKAAAQRLRGENIRSDDNTIGGKVIGAGTIKYGKFDLPALKLQTSKGTQVVTLDEFMGSINKMLFGKETNVTYRPKNKPKKEETATQPSLFKEIALKHLAGQHNQKRHGWRYGGLSQARSSMRRQSESERTEYRKRAGMPKPEKKPRIEQSKIDLSKHPDDLKGFDEKTIKLAVKGIDSYTGTPGFEKEGYFVSRGIHGGKDEKWQVSHVDSGSFLMGNFKSKKSAMLFASSIIRNVPSMKNGWVKQEFLGGEVNVLNKKAMGDFLKFVNSVQDKVKNYKSYKDAIPTYFKSIE